MEEKKRTVLARLAASRVALQKKNLKMSGENKFAGYKYFKLQDFLHEATEILMQNELCAVFDFQPNHAELHIADFDNWQERITFHIPSATAALKGCHDIQNLGAVQSYQRRYLYLAAMEICEDDELDATTGAPEKSQSRKPVTQPPKAKEPVAAQTDAGEGVTLCSEAQRKLLFACVKTSGATPEQFKKYLVDKFALASTSDIPVFLVNQIKAEIQEGALNA